MLDEAHGTRVVFEKVGSETHTLKLESLPNIFE